VQQSAAPNAYAAWEDEARGLAVALTGEVPAGFSCRLAGFGGAAPAPGALSSALASEMGGNLINVSVATKTGWQVASWLVAHAYNYHVAGVSFGGMTWRAGTGKWAANRGRPAPQMVTVQAG
jgi:hypothetical protein